MMAESAALSLSVLLCVSISTGLSCLLSVSLSLSLSLRQLSGLPSLCASFFLKKWCREDSQVVWRPSACFVRRPAMLLSLCLSVSCFLPVYLSPPSHMHKSKTHQELSPPTHLPFSLPLLVSLSSPPPLPSFLLSLIRAPPKYLEYKSHSPFPPVPFLLFLTLSSLPLSPF